MIAGILLDWDMSKPDLKIDLKIGSFSDWQKLGGFVFVAVVVIVLLLGLVALTFDTRLRLSEEEQFERLVQTLNPDEVTREFEIGDSETANEIELFATLSPFLSKADLEIVYEENADSSDSSDSSDTNDDNSEPIAFFRLTHRPVECQANLDGERSNGEDNEDDTEDDSNDNCRAEAAGIWTPNLTGWMNIEDFSPSILGPFSTETDFGDEIYNGARLRSLLESSETGREYFERHIEPLLYDPQNRDLSSIELLVDTLEALGMADTPNCSQQLRQRAEGIVNHPLTRQSRELLIQIRDLPRECEPDIYRIARLNAQAHLDEL